MFPPFIYEDNMAKVREASTRASELLDVEMTSGGKEHLEKICEFEFYNIEEPGLSLQFSYGPTTKPTKYKMWHGQKYKVPRKVAEHIETRQTPMWGYRPNGEGKMIKALIGWKSRFQMREVRS